MEGSLSQLIKWVYKYYKFLSHIFNFTNKKNRVMDEHDFNWDVNSLKSLVLSPPQIFIYCKMHNAYITCKRKSYVTHIVKDNIVFSLSGYALP